MRIALEVTMDNEAMQLYRGDDAEDVGDTDSVVKAIQASMSKFSYLNVGDRHDIKDANSVTVGRWAVFEN